MRENHSRDEWQSVQEDGPGRLRQIGDEKLGDEHSSTLQKDLRVGTSVSKYGF